MTFNPADFGATPVTSGGFDPSQFGATPVNSGATGAAGAWQSVAKAQSATQPAAPVDPRQSFTPTAVAKVPGQLASAAKSIFDFFTGSEKAVGGELASGLPTSVTGEADLNKANQGNASSDVAFIKAINAQRTADKPVTPIQQQIYDHILQTNSSVGTQTDLLPHASDTNTQALGNVAGTAADLLGAGTYGKAAKAAETGTLLRKTAPSVITKASDAAGAAKALVTSTPEQLAAKQTAKIVDTVSPKLTAAETSAAIAARGGSKTGLLRTITANPDPAVQRIAQTVQKYVPDFNPAKSLVENINATKTTVGTLADDLKQAVVASGKDRIYSFKQLGASLNGLEKPTLLVGDSEKVYKNVISKAMEIARSNGGKVSDLFQARKEFDQFVSKQIPNLYNSDTQTAMRSPILQPNIYPLILVCAMR
jgi:hypothetical protein